MTEVPEVEAANVDEDVVEAVKTDQVVEPVVTDIQEHATWAVGEWLGRPILDRDGERIGKLQDVYVDVETDEPQFGTVKEGIFSRHLTFVPLVGVQVGPDYLQVTAAKEQVRSAPDIELQGEELSQADESTLYHHFEQNYTPMDTRERTSPRSSLREVRSDRAAGQPESDPRWGSGTPGGCAPCSFLRGRCRRRTG